MIPSATMRQAVGAGDPIEKVADFSHHPSIGAIVSFLGGSKERPVNHLQHEAGSQDFVMIFSQ